MTGVDVGIVIFVLVFAVLGVTRGLVASALPLIGFLAGAALGSRLGPLLLAGGADSRWAPIVTLISGVLLGAVLAVALDGLGARLRARLVGHALVRRSDGLGGAALFAVLALLMVWALGAVALHSPAGSAGELRALVQRSSVLGALNDALPPSGPLLRVLREVSPTPVVRGPDPDVPPPDPTLADDPEIDAAARSVVRVTGVACGLGVAGSGWVARPGIVVTNAHVVAGQDETLVTSADGVESEAQVVFYEPRDDLAVLAGGDLDVPALRLDVAPLKGKGGAVAGYPENGPLTVVPARLGTTGVVASQDSYGRGPIRRRMTAFRADVRSGNSGGPVLDGRGRVMATVFAASAEQGPPSGLGVPNELVAAALEGPLEPVEPGPCAA